MAETPDDQPPVDPVEFMRRVMHISPEDAEKVRKNVREQAPTTRNPAKKHGKGKKGQPS